MQRIAPHTLPPQGRGQQGAQSEKNQPLPPALLLARRIRREQGAEQVRRFLTAMEPFLAPNERRSIAEQLGIRLPQKEEKTQAPPTPCTGEKTERGKLPPQEPQNQMNNMAQQLQMLQLLSQLGGGQGGGFNPMMLTQLMNGMNGNGNKKPYR